MTLGSPELSRYSFYTSTFQHLAKPKENWSLLLGFYFESHSLSTCSLCMNQITLPIYTHTATATLEKKARPPRQSVQEALTLPSRYFRQRLVSGCLCPLLHSLFLLYFICTVQVPTSVAFHWAVLRARGTRPTLVLSQQTTLQVPLSPTHQT